MGVAGEAPKRSRLLLSFLFFFSAISCANAGLPRDCLFRADPTLETMEKRRKVYLSFLEQPSASAAGAPSTARTLQPRNCHCRQRGQTHRTAERLGSGLAVQRHGKTEPRRSAAAQSGSARAVTLPRNTPALTHAERVPPGTDTTQARQCPGPPRLPAPPVIPVPLLPAWATVGSYTAIMNCKRHSCLRDEISPFKLHSCPTKGYFPRGEKSLIQSGRQLPQSWLLRPGPEQRQTALKISVWNQRG